MAKLKVLAVSRDTPHGTADVRVVVLSAARIVTIRVVRTYLQSLLGFLGATAIGAIPTNPLAPQDAWQRIALAAGLALFPAFVAAIQNVLELLGQLDARNPELRG